MTQTHGRLLRRIGVEKWRQGGKVSFLVMAFVTGKMGREEKYLQTV